MTPLFFLYTFLFSIGCAASSLRGSPAVYDTNQSNICVWLSGAAYCDKDNYESMKLAGPASGFELTNVLYDKHTDLQGYVGYLAKANSIYVIFRGTSSMTNWLDDAEIIQTSYTTFPECDCKVHSGFYKSAVAVRDTAISSVRALLAKYPHFKIYVSGHSYGAAVAQLISMELIAKNIPSNVYNYGQPRIGNAKYAEFVNTKLTTMFRLTHDKDMVPHVPLTSMNYVHSCVEVFEDKENDLHICSSENCEDPKCADQYSLYQTNTEDHHVYLNHPLSCEDSTDP